ncbi:MAG: AAA family ATPase [Proteobacteria bacterium]|nr:AAA family ATPase [Pseudomonadota bacterium]
MPFLKHFGLKDYPFGLTPNTGLYYPSAEMEAILTALCFSLSRGDGLIKVVGEVGTGKTLLARLLLERLKKKSVEVAYFPVPYAIAPRDIPERIVHEFGIKLKKSENPAEALNRFLLTQHAAGRRIILVIDEAQSLGREGLEAVRLLTNLETKTDKLLQIILFGQPELDMLLATPDMRQFLQRVVFSYRLVALDRATVARYLGYRLNLCRYKARKSTKEKLRPNETACGVRFHPSAARRIASVSAGLPRLVHVLADKALMACYVDGAQDVALRHVRKACLETEGVAWHWRFFCRFM